MVNEKVTTLKFFLLLIVIVAPLYSLGLANHGLWSPDEPRVAEVSREMAIAGNWAVPALNQKPFLEEPPLYYASLAFFFKIFGASDKVARIPSALFAFAGVLALFFMANFLFGPRVALLSGLILATTAEYFRVAHWVIVDGALTFFVISAMGCFMVGYGSDREDRKLIYYTLFYVACTLAFYVKGFIGIAIPGLGVVAFLAFEGNLKELVKMKPWLGVAVFLVMAAPWFFALWHQAGAEPLKVFLLHNHLQRFLPGSMAGNISGHVSGHHHPFYYYLTEFPSGFLPWSIFLIPSLCLSFGKLGRVSGLPEKGRLFAKCWLLAGFIFLSIASTKRTLYLMPIFAPMAMLTALYVNHTIDAFQSHDRLQRIGKIFMWAFGIILLVIGLGLTPTYLYSKRIYLSGTSPGLSISTVALSTLLVFLSLNGLWSLARGHMKRYWVSMGLPVFCILFFAVTVFVPILDRYKSFNPFCNLITAIVPAGSSLYAYQPDETARGAVPFYTGRYVKEISDITNDSFMKADLSYVMIRDRNGRLEKELSATGRLFVVARQEMGTDRSLVLLSNRPHTEPVRTGVPADKNVEPIRGGASR